MRPGVRGDTVEEGEVTVEAKEEERIGEELTDSIYAAYKRQKLSVPGAIVESLTAAQFAYKGKLSMP